MDILRELDEKNRELNTCYAIIQLQEEQIKSLSDSIKHLEEILMNSAEIIKFNKE